MAAKVDRDRLPSTLGNRGRRSSPGAAGLAASVQEHHSGCKWIAEAVRDDANAANAVGAEQVRCRTHGISIRDPATNASMVARGAAKWPMRLP